MDQEPLQIGLYAESAEQTAKSFAIGEQFGISILEAIPENRYYLFLNQYGLSLRNSTKGSAGPVFIDFTGGALNHRRLMGGGRRQTLARAIGLKPGYNPVIVDATTGLGRDAFVLANCGCTILMCERSPILAALLENALTRAANDPEIGDWINTRMKLNFSDSVTTLNTLSGESLPDVVYLDPMYPHSKRSAKVKKEMQTLQTLLGADRDSSELFALSLKKARRRVVVKRPKWADCLDDSAPDTMVESKNTRYDIYISHEQIDGDKFG